MRAIFAAPLAAFLLLPPVTSQQSETRTAAPAETFVLEVGSHEIPDLIDRAAAHLDYNILHNPHEPARRSSNPHP